MSRLIYNGIELSYIQTREIDREPQMSDDGMEYLYTKVTIAVRAVLHTSLNPALTGEEPAVIDKRIRHYLETPRGVLQFYVKDKLLYESDRTMDCKNGPFPDVYRIERVAEKSFLVNFSVTTYLVECPAGTGAPQYASWRYRQTVDIDENWYTTLTTTGKIVTRADMRTNPDALRGVVAPVIEPGFKRVSSNFILQEDGLAAQFTFVDKEVYLQPPQLPGMNGMRASEADGEYMETTPQGTVRMGRCRVALEGPKTASKADLLGLAVLIAVSKLTANLANPDTLIQGGITESLWKNKVEVDFQAQLTPTIQRLKLGGKDVGIDTTRFNRVIPGSEPGQPSLNLGVRGTAMIQLLQGVLNDPCVPIGAIINHAPGESTISGQGNVPEATISTTPLLPNDFGGLFCGDHEHDPGMYNTYEMTNYYERDENTFALPVASSSSTVDTVICRTAKPQVRLISEWSGEKLTSRPTIPASPAASDPNAVHMQAKLAPSGPSVAGDASTMIFPDRGRLVTAYKDANKVYVNHPRPAWMCEAVMSNLVVGVGDFNATLFTFGPGVGTPPWPTIQSGGGGSTITGGGGQGA